MSADSAVVRDARRDLWAGLIITALGAGLLGRSSFTLFAPAHHAHQSHELIAVVLAIAVIAAGVVQFVSGLRLLARGNSSTPV